MSYLGNRPAAFTGASFRSPSTRGVSAGIFGLWLTILLGLHPIRAFADTPSQCEEAFRQGGDSLNRGHYPTQEQPQHPAASLFARAVEICEAQRARTADPEKKAYLAATEYLARARHAIFDRSPNRSLDRAPTATAYDLVRDGIELVTSWTSPIHPALLPLLAEMDGLELTVNDDNQAALRILEQSLDILRNTYGEDDGRYAQGLYDLALFYTPTNETSGSSSSWTDARIADRYYQEALRIRLARPDGPGLDLETLAVMMQANYVEMGETEKAAALDAAIEAAMVENEIREKIAAEEATLAAEEPALEAERESPSDPAEAGAIDEQSEGGSEADPDPHQDPGASSADPQH